MNILFINPPADCGVRQVREGRCMQRAGAWTAIWAPISLATTASLIREKGYGVNIVDCIVENISFPQLEPIIRQYQPSLVVINAVTPSIESDLSTCQLIKSINPVIATAIIGIHGTALPADCFRMQPHLDFVIRGEPEYTVLELCSVLNNNNEPQTIAGLSYRKGSELIHNPDRKPLENLDILPFPAWDLIKRDKYRLPFTNRQFLLVGTSRGCPFSCTFCADHVYYGKALRLRSPKRIVDEIEFNMKQFGVKDFLFWSESFTINNQFSCQVAEEIIHRKLQIRWVCNSRVDNVSEELLSLIRKAGCWMIGYGVESANQGVLDSVKKGINTEDTILAVTLAKKAGLEVTAHCILGFPQDTKETIKETINFVKKLPIDYAQFYCAVPFPGSILFEEASRAGWVCSDDWRRFEQNFSVLNTPNLSAGEIMKLRNLAYTSFYFRPQKAIKILNNIKSIPQAIALVKGVFDFLRWM